MRYWEDFVVGQDVVHGTHEITAEEIVRFGREFDPQPFHTDLDAPADGPFGGLIASGWHSAALYMGMFVRNVLLDSASLGSPGVEELRWLVPVRPGDVLTGRSRVVDAWRQRARSRARHDRRRARARQPARGGRDADAGEHGFIAKEAGLMRTRALGEGGPEVSVVGLGTNNFGGALRPTSRRRR